MLYQVILAPQADADLRATYHYIRRRAPQGAREWIRRARQDPQDSLPVPRTLPACSPRDTGLTNLLLELLFGGGNRGTYRFLFVVENKSVYIVHLRHGSMLPLSPEE